MYDLLVKNGLVANEYNVLPLDVAVKDEKVVALAIHGALDEIDAKHVIDAQGKYVLPGGIDPHVHYDISANGYHSGRNRCGERQCQFRDRLQCGRHGDLDLPCGLSRWGHAGL